VLLEQVIQKSSVFIRDARIHFFAVESTSITPCEFTGEKEVDSKGLVADFVFDPFEFAFEILLRMACDTQDAEAACLGDCGGDVTAVGESEDRHVESEIFSQL